MDNVFIPSTWRRLAAHFIDQVLRLFFYLPFAKPFFLLLFSDHEVPLSLAQLIGLFLVPTIYEVLFLVLMQATPGKWIMGLKVVPAHNPFEYLSWQQCVLRPITQLLTFFFSWAIYAMAFFRYDRTHLADWIAETRVVQSTPRFTRASVRPFLGILFVLMNGFEGLSSARSVLDSIRWEEGMVDLRSLVDVEDFEGLGEFDDFEDL